MVGRFRAILADTITSGVSTDWTRHWTGTKYIDVVRANANALRHALLVSAIRGVSDHSLMVHPLLLLNAWAPSAHRRRGRRVREGRGDECHAKKMGQTTQEL